MARSWHLRHRFVLAAVLVAGGAVACGPVDEGEPEQVGRSLAEVKVCADGEVVEGIDVSYYQGMIDWPAVAADGVVFGIARVNHGDFMDPEFGPNWQGMRDVGIVRGAYQYFDPGGDPVVQANVMVDHLGWLEPGDLPPVIDVESTDGLPPAQIAANVSTWIDIVREGTGRDPIIYTGSYFWNDNVGTDEFNDHPLWIAHYQTDCPNMPNAWPDWAFWQYTDSGSIAGIAGNVDRNLFNGPPEALHDLAANGYRAELVTIDAPMAMQPGSEAEVTVVVDNLGARGWSAGTLLGTTMPRDRESDFAADTWVAPNRVLAMPVDVAPGESVSLTFTVVAPLEPGTYTEHFNLVEEGVAWFSDTPPGGGPDDDVIALTIEVSDDAPGSTSSASSSSSSSSGSGGLTVVDGVRSQAADGGSCALSPVRGRSHWPAWGLFGATLVWLARRRRPQRSTNQ